jgi:MacB-like periplasmic core domain
MQTLWQDLRFGIRMLGKSPAYTTVAVVTLAIAIGANAVVFGALNGAILRPLNVPHAESLFQVRGGPDDANLSYPDYLDLRDRNRSFDGLAAYNFSQAGLDTGENPSRAWVCEVSGNYFDVLGIQPYLGRVIHAADERGPNSAPDIVLTYAYWHSHFQDDRGVVGRTVQLNKHPFTILGVTPAGFRGTVLIFSPDFFVPMVNQEQVDGWNGLNDRGNRWVGAVVGHLKAGISAAQTVADLNSIGSYLERTYPKEDSQVSFMVAREGLPGVVFGRAIKAFIPLRLDGNRCAVDQLGGATAEEENHLGYVLGLWPLRKIGVWYRPAVRLGVNDAGKNRVCADAGTFQICRKRIDHCHCRSLGRSIRRRGRRMINCLC